MKPFGQNTDLQYNSPLLPPYVPSRAVQWLRRSIGLYIRVKQWSRLVITLIYSTDSTLLTRSSVAKTKYRTVYSRNTVKPLSHNTDLQYSLHAAHAQFSGQDENIRLYFGLKLEVQLNRSYISVPEV